MIKGMELITPKQASKMLHISTSTLRREVERGKIPVAERTPAGHARFQKEVIESIRDGKGIPQIEYNKIPKKKTHQDIIEWKDKFMNDIHKEVATYDKIDRIDVLLPECVDYKTADLIVRKLIEDYYIGSDVAAFFWKENTRRLLGLMMWAAAVMDEPSERVMKWIEEIRIGHERGSMSELQAIVNWKNKYRAKFEMKHWGNIDKKIRQDTASCAESFMIQMKNVR